MFGVWHPGPREKKDVVVMYSLTQDRLSDAEIGYRFDRLGPLETRFVYKGRTEAGRFFYRIGYGLRPPTADRRKMDITGVATDQP
jgi:dolichol-phosphate mannosyltransferase